MSSWTSIITCFRARHSFRLFSAACGTFIYSEPQSCLLFSMTQQAAHRTISHHFTSSCMWPGWGFFAFLPRNPKDRVLGFKAINILNSCMCIVNLTILTTCYHDLFVLQTSTLDISLDTWGGPTSPDELTKLWQFAMRRRNFGHGVGVEVPFNKLTISPQNHEK